MIDQDISKFFSKSVYGLRYTQTFQQGTLEIYTHYGTFVDTDNHDPFPIENVSYVECELNNNFRRGYKTIGIDNIDLTFEELLKIEDWLTTYFIGENNYPDIAFSAYDPKDHNLFQGNMLLSEIKENNFYFTTIPCPYSVAKYNELDDTWIEIKAIIRDDGSYVLDPDGYCDKCVLFLTNEEWEVLPPPEGANDPEAALYYIRYDFTTESWKDIRTPEDFRTEYEVLVKGRFGYLISSTADYYFGTDNQYAASLSQTSNIKIDYTSENYKSGAQSIADLFGVSSDIVHEEDFSKEFYEESFKQAREHLEGQRDLWLQLPDRINSSFYDLSTKEGWLNLINKFRVWVEEIYSE